MFRIRHEEEGGSTADGDALADGYQMLEELGSGSFGIVYKAIEKATGEIVAVKHVDLESSEEDIADIQAEIAVLGSCASPFVTRYKTAFLRGQKLWIVMEYLGGGSCQDLLKPGTISESHIAIILREILHALVYLHSTSKIHRDIKAANILLSLTGAVKLADFGVAAQLSNLKSIRNTFVGTPFWMAPEVIQQSGHDSKADIWSLGITAVELVRGEPPLAEVHPMKVLFLIPKNPAPRLEGNQYSRDFKDFVAACLVKDSDHRPSARDLLKHRFIRSAGKVEQLQELIVRRQEWEASRGGEERLKYYAETMRSLPKPSHAEIDDDWVFETVKAIPVAHTRKGNSSHGQKRRKVEIKDDQMEIDQNTATTMMENLSLSTQTPTKQTEYQELSSTMRKVSLPTPTSKNRQSPTTSIIKRSTRRRVPSGQRKQPLGVNMSFGNSPSTVRQFKRVSPNAENADQSISLPKQSRLTERTSSDTENMPPSPTPDFSSTATALLPEAKEVSLGKRIYAKAIGLSCQDVLNTTGDQEKREAVARLAEAFSDLEMIDPEGIHHILKSTIEKMQADPKLAELLPQPLVSPSVSLTSTLNSHPSTPQRNAAKLVLAQNNPHLKSHRRRQSAQVQRVESSNLEIWSPQSEDKSLLKNMPGGPGGLEHTRALADVLFDRWCEGLRMRWPSV